jgi:hypothetical protein
VNRRLDDRIRELANRAIAASQADVDVEPILKELLALVHEKLERLRRIAMSHLLEGGPVKERRSNEPDYNGLNRQVAKP